MLLVLSVSALGFGGILPEVRALTHGLLALGLVGALALPGRALVGAGAVRDLTVGLGVLSLAVAAALLPAPRGLLMLGAPGVAAARPDDPWWTWSLVPEDTVGEVAYWGMLLGMGVLAGVWGAARRRRRDAERGAVLLGLMVAIVAAGHHFAGESALFGVYPSGLASAGFFAPFVDRNHIGAAMALCLPVAFGVVLRARPLSGWWIAAIGLLGLGSVLIARSGSRGAGLGLLVCSFVVLWRGRSSSRGALAAVGMGLAGVLGLVLGTTGNVQGFDPESRLIIWKGGLASLADAWLFGAGGGTVHAAVAPYRTDHEPVVWTFLHNDLLEWVVETGLVGGVAGLIGAWFLVPRATPEPDRALWPSLGLVALLVNAAVEFPLQMPALALGFVALLAVRRAAYEERRLVDVRVVRGCVLLALLVQIAAGAWMAREAVADRASAVALGWSRDRDAAYEAADRLGWVAPWRGERKLVAAWEAEADGDRALAAERAREIRAAHPDRANLLRQAALVLWRAGAREEAIEILDRAGARAPADWRTWVVRARLQASQGEKLSWAQAFERGAPAGFVEEAYDSLPLGVFWVEALGDLPRHQLRLAELLLRRSDPTAAVLAFEQAAVQGEPHHPGHVRALLELGRVEEAERRSRSALEDTGDPRFAELLAGVLAETGRYGEARDLYLGAARSRLGAGGHAVRMAALEGGLAEADRLVRRMELVGSVDPETWLTLAELRLEAGDRVGCRAELRRHRLTEVARTAGRARSLERRCAADR